MRTVRHFARERYELARFGQRVDEAFEQARRVRIRQLWCGDCFAGLVHRLTRYSNPYILLYMCSGIFVLKHQVGIASAAFEGSLHLAANVVLISVLGYGGSLVLDGAMTAGDLTSFILYVL